jgi:hypothetical protein
MMSSCTSIRASFYATAPAETAHKTHHYIEIIGQKRAVNLLVAHGKVRIHGDAIEAGVAAQQVVSCLAPDCPVLVGLCRETPARVEPEPCLQRVRQAGSL